MPTRKLFYVGFLFDAYCQAQERGISLAASYIALSQFFRMV